jgi:2-methylcitrate dehydratase PrpD
MRDAFWRRPYIYLPHETDFFTARCTFVLMTTLTRELARFAASLTFEQLPGAVVSMAKQLTLDTLGTTLAASTLGAGCAEVVDVMARLGGPAESSIFGRTAKVAASNAAFANGALAHALNYDAVGAATGHTGVVCFAAPFALAEAAAPVSGSRYLTAVVAAAEVTARLTLAAHRGSKPVSSRILTGQYFSYFGAAAGAAHILGLDALHMHSTFGLALMQTAGSRQIVIGGDPPAKAVYGAFPSQAGVLAALLAQTGLQADIDAVAGVAGLYGIATDGAFDDRALIDGLGDDFAFLDVAFKPWPTSNHVTPFIEAAIELSTRYHLRPEDIATVEVVGPNHIVDWFEPMSERRRPSNAASAANSTMFAVAKVFLHGNVSLSDFTAAGLRDEQALQLADRITYRLDERVAAGCVSVRTADGREREVCVDKALGDPLRPMSQDRLESKFRDCCAHARDVSPEDASRLIGLIDTLETLDDVACIAAAPSRRSS